MCNVICVANLREKTGRTCATVNFAASLALLEQKVLVVDCDPGGHASACLGTSPHDYDFGLNDLLSGIVGGRAVVRKTAIDFLDLIPSGEALDDIERILAQNPDKEKVLSIVLKKFRESYDFIIFDTPPKKSLIMRSTIVACDSLMIPTFLGTGTVEDVLGILGFASDVRQKMEEPLKIAGILFMNCRGQEEINQYYMNNEINDFKHAICPVTIPEKPNVMGKDAGSKPMCLIDLKSEYAEAFLDLSYEFLYRESNK